MVENSEKPVNSNAEESAPLAVAVKKARCYKKISETQGSERVFRLVNLTFAILLAIACCAWGIYRIVMFGVSDPHLRFLASFGIGAIAVLPLLLERIFKFNLSGFVWLLYLIFLLMAGFIGSGLGMYITWESWNYDKITHGVFGYIGCVFALLLLCKLTDFPKNKLAFVLIVCFSVSMACGAMWEIFEFSCDRFLGAHAQGDHVFNGYASVKDTMGDIVANFFGAVAFLLHYLAHYFTKKNLLIGSMLKDFTA